MLKLNNVTKKYDSGNTVVTALDIGNFEIGNGEFISLVGPSGSGKSTFLHIIGLVDNPTNGEIYIDNKNIHDLKSNDLCLFRRDSIGFVFQSFNLLPHLSALENVMIPLIPYRVNFNLKAKAEEHLVQVGLKDRLTHLPSQLSGGEQQRVAIARALINNPKIIIADEPTGNLDTAARDEILDILIGLNRKGLTIVLATHDMEIAQMTDKVLYLRDGMIRKVEVLDHV